MLQNARFVLKLHVAVGAFCGSHWAERDERTTEKAEFPQSFPPTATSLSLILMADSISESYESLIPLVEKMNQLLPVCPRHRISSPCKLTTLRRSMTWLVTLSLELRSSRTSFKKHAQNAIYLHKRRPAPKISSTSPVKRFNSTKPSWGPQRRNSARLRTLLATFVIGFKNVASPSVPSPLLHLHQPPRIRVE